MTNDEVRAVHRDILRLMERNAGLLTKNEQDDVKHYLGVGEEEMAFEGLCLDLMPWPETSIVDLEEMMRLGKLVGLDQESVYDADFWKHLIEILEKRRQDAR